MPLEEQRREAPEEPKESPKIKHGPGGIRLNKQNSCKQAHLSASEAQHLKGLNFVASLTMCSNPTSMSFTDRPIYKSKNS